jgi:hypothetical protein
MGTVIPQEFGYPPLGGASQYILLALSQLGMFAVPSFLFVSGCFFAYASGGDQSKLSFKTVLAGLRHIFWPYLIWSIIFYFVIYVGQNTTYSISGYLKNLIVGYPFDFIPLLAFFYVLSPVLIRLGRQFGYILIGLIALYQITLLNLIYPGILGFLFPGWLHVLVPPVIRHTMADWGIYFPLGVVYSLHAKSLSPQFIRFKWILVSAIAVMYIVAYLNAASVLVFPLADHICPLLFLLTFTIVKRNSIPIVRNLEKIGKRSYGLYLTNLIVLYIILLLIKVLFPGLLSYQLLLLPFLFGFALLIPLTFMISMEHLPIYRVYPYIFG